MHRTEFLLWNEPNLLHGEGLLVSLRIAGRPANSVPNISVRNLEPLLDPDTGLPWERITADEWPIQVTTLEVDLVRKKAELRGILVQDCATAP